MAKLEVKCQICGEGIKYVNWKKYREWINKHLKEKPDCKWFEIRVETQ